MAEAEGFAIGTDDPLLDPANVPNRPLPGRGNIWKGVSKSLRGCLAVGFVTAVVLCILLTVLVYLLLETVLPLLTG